MRTVVLLVLMLGASLAHAHGLLVSVNSDGQRIAGTAYFTNGDVAVSQVVEALDLDVAGAQPQAGSTGADGSFGFPAQIGHRYRISVFGEEDHRVDVELLAGAGTRSKLIEPEGGEQASPWWPPPAWAVIGGLLLASLVPVLVSRARRKL